MCLCVCVRVCVYMCVSHTWVLVCRAGVSVVSEVIQCGLSHTLVHDLTLLKQDEVVCSHTHTHTHTHKDYTIEPNSLKHTDQLQCVACTVPSCSV